MVVPKFGTAVWYGDGNLAKIFEQRKKLGFDYAEVSLEYPFYPSRKLYLTLNKLRKEFSMQLAFHLPISELNVAHPADEVSDFSLGLAERFIGWCGDLEPLYVNLHLHATSSSVKLEDIRKLCLKKAEKIVRRLAKLSKENNLTVTWENGTYGLGNRLSDWKYLKEKCGKRLRVCLDVGHISLISLRKGLSTEATEKEIVKWMKALRDNIVALHFHNVRKLKASVRDHLSAFSGELNSERILEVAKERLRLRAVLVETFYYLKDGKSKRITREELKKNLKFVKEVWKG